MVDIFYSVSGRSLVWVGILGLVVFYLYALISFALLRSSFDANESMYCATLWQCTVTVIRYGLVGDIFDVSVLNCFINTFLRAVYAKFHQSKMEFFYPIAFFFLIAEHSEPPNRKHLHALWFPCHLPSVILHFHHNHRSEHYLRYHSRHIL